MIFVVIKYKSLLTKNVSALAAAGSGGGSASAMKKNARSLVNIIASLRKACNHPYVSGVTYCVMS